MTPTEKEAVIAEYIRTPTGKQALAALMVRPFRGLVFDYVPCLACGKSVRSDRMAKHASSFTDEGHLVVEVMES